MFAFWLLLAVLGPVIGCAAFVMLAPSPDPMTAAAGAIFGMLASLLVAMLFA